MLLLALAPIASASFIGPEDGGSPNADRIHTLYVIVLIVGAVIFVLVEGLLIAAIIKFRRKRGGPEPALVHGNTPLEVGWTIGAAVIVASLAAVTFAFLPSIKNPPDSNANGLQQFAGLRVRLAQPAQAAQRQGAAHQRGGPAVHLALRLRPGQAAHREPAGVRLLLDGGAHEHHGDPPDQLGGRDPLLVDPAGSAARPTPSPATTTTPGSRSRSPASTTGSARSCAATTTPTCARRCTRSRRISSRHG